VLSQTATVHLYRRQLLHNSVTIATTCPTHVTQNCRPRTPMGSLEHGQTANHHCLQCQSLAKDMINNHNSLKIISSPESTAHDWLIQMLKTGTCIYVHLTNGIPSHAVKLFRMFWFHNNSHLSNIKQQCV